MAFLWILRNYALGSLLISVCRSSPPSMISGIFGEDVLLPCLITYKEIFELDKLVVNWQTENDVVVHSFFYEKDHPEYQGEGFIGRTQMFPQEFAKGNLSLLLKSLEYTDSGKYVCYVSLNYIHSAWTDLSITDKDELPLYKRMYLLKVGSLLTFAVVISSFVILLRVKKKRKRHSEENQPLLRKDKKEYIEEYKEYISALSKTTSEKEKTGDSIQRTLLIPEWRTDATIDNTGSSVRLRRKQDTLSSEDLFTRDNMVLSSKRMLLAGEAGIGKSCFSRGLQERWASKDNRVYYECIIYFTFAELKAIKSPVSVNELLANKCKHLEPILPELLESGRVLIILDGYDEFITNNEENTLNKTVYNDTPLPVETLILNILSKALLPNTDILVTSRLSSRNVENTNVYFERTFIMQEFTDDQIKQFYTKFCSDDISQTIHVFIEEHNLSSLVSIPLLSSALFELSKNDGLRNSNLQRLTTQSEMMSSLLKVCLKNILSCDNDSNEQCCSVDMPGRNLPFNIKNMVEQLAKMSYINLLSDEEVIQVQNLESCVHTRKLLDAFSEFFFKKTNEPAVLKYRHTSIRDMFAALHCAWNICKSQGIYECLNAWTWGIMPEQSSNTHGLLQNKNFNSNIVFDKFLNFFMGFFMYPDIDSLYNSEKSQQRVHYLKIYFEMWIKNQPTCSKLLNLFHCIYELQENELTETLSGEFTTVDLFNTPLNALNIRAVEYTLKKSKLNKLDLTLCDLRNEHLKQLQIIIQNSAEVNLSSNMLNNKSGTILKDILEHPNCAIKELFLAINKLGPTGVNEIWEALKTNKSIEKLNLCDNELQDDGTENMLSSLCMNKTLKKLILCMNSFTDTGMKKITELMQKRRDLTIVMKTTEDEEFFLYVKGQVDSLESDGWKEYHRSWVHHILRIVKKDLNDADQNKNVTLLKRSISKIMDTMKCAEQNQAYIS